MECCGDSLSGGPGLISKRIVYFYFVPGDDTLFQNAMNKGKPSCSVTPPAPHWLREIFESAIPLCVDVTSQNSPHYTAAIERVDTDAAPWPPPFSSHHHMEKNKNQRKRKGGMGSTGGERAQR